MTYEQLKKDVYQEMSESITEWGFEHRDVESLSHTSINEELLPTILTKALYSYSQNEGFTLSDQELELLYEQLHDELVGESFEDEWAIVHSMLNEPSDPMTYSGLKWSDFM